MTQEEMDEASEAWEWIPSYTIWLEKNVSSDFYIPPQPFPVTKNLKVVRLECVHGIPSQFPVPRVPTAYIINFSSVRDAYKDADELITIARTATLGMVLRARKQMNRAPMVNGQLFTGLGHFGHVQCRRARQHCQGVMFCPSIDPSLITVERYKLDLHARDAVNNTQIVQCLNQGSVIQDKAICYVNAVRAMKCTGKDSAGAFPHLKEGKIYTAAMVKRKCEAATAILVPLDEETVPIAIVIPKHLCPHTHPPPPATRVPTDVRLLYERAVRVYGISVATVNKVEQASPTIEIMGAAPGFGSPFPSERLDQTNNHRGSETPGTRRRQIWMGRIHATQRDSRFRLPVLWVPPSISKRDRTILCMIGMSDPAPLCAFYAAAKAVFIQREATSTSDVTGISASTQTTC
ncbi:hypothetical protein B0H14DRAFT_2601170 [Mycena olivaceomarginata]|nr:hypothetical protein B0H14DRAFT_2601170 [Mycena olivaceomarginata]